VVFDIEPKRWNDDDDDDTEEFAENLQCLDLRGLDQFFCQPRFLHLQVVSFRCHEPDKYGEVEQMIELNMPACLSRGILSIQNA
jgi:hypothetical protein